MKDAKELYESMTWSKYGHGKIDMIAFAEAYANKRLAGLEGGLMELVRESPYVYHADIEELIKNQIS